MRISKSLWPNPSYEDLPCIFKGFMDLALLLQVLFLFFFICVCACCVYFFYVSAMCVRMLVEPRNDHQIPQELALQALVSYVMWVLGTPL